MESVRTEVDAAALAALCSDRYLLAKAVDEGFVPELLASSWAQVVAKTLLHLREEHSGAIDLLLLKSKLEQDGLLVPEVEQVLDSMAKLAPPSLDRLMSYLDFLKERWSRNQLHELAANIDAYARNKQAGSSSVADFTGAVIERLLDIQKHRLRRRLRPLGDEVRQIAVEAQDRADGAKSHLGYSVAPFARLNEVLSGLRPGFYYGLAGAPRRGKTNFALQLASAVAANDHIPVLFYSWEQTQRVLTARLIGKESGLNPVSLLTQDLSAQAAAPDALARGLSSLAKYDHRLFLVEGSRQDTVGRIRASAYNLMHEFRTDHIAIFLDYLQKVPLAAAPSDARARIDEISTTLADLSLELACPVFAVSSIDKEGCRLDDEPNGEEKFDELLHRPRPTMHNCTGSGDIEYDLDVAMILAKDWKATQELEELLKSKWLNGPVPKIDIIDLHVDKNRDAPAEAGQAIQYAFFVHENRFVELGYKSEEEYKADFRGFAKVQEIFAALLDKGDLPTMHIGAGTR
jgi:replicative DNA helicase